MTRELPAPEQLRKLLRYEPDTGKLFWRKRTPDMFKPTGQRCADGCCANWNSRYADKEAFTAFDGHGYYMGRIFNKAYKAHRVAWCIVYGHWPEDQIDHKNGVRSDNRMQNLRAVDQSENSKNAKKRSDNTSGVTGVVYDRIRKKWMVKMFSKSFGRFDDMGAAISARKLMEEQQGFTERHGK
jgi:hypothetical protein